MSHDRHYHHPGHDPERRKWQDPEAILLGLGLKAGDNFIDLGCGGGFFAIPAAKITGEKGKVYGVDVDEVSIGLLREAAAREKLGNLYLTVGKAEETVLCRGCGDIVFIGMALHDFQDPARVLLNARKMVKPGGRLANLDWKKQAMVPGPPLAKRFDEKQAARLIEAAGFIIESITDSGPYHYLIIARP